MANKQLTLSLYKFGNDKIKLFWNDEVVKNQTKMWEKARELRDFLKSIEINEFELPVIQIINSDQIKSFIEFKVTSNKNILMKMVETTKKEIPIQNIQVQRCIKNEDYIGYKFLSPSLSKVWKEASKMASE